MSKRLFSYWLKTFRDSINGYRYYTDFTTVYEKAERLKVEINILNSLVGSRSIESDFEKLIKKYPECLKAIPILIAVRETEIVCQDENGSKNYRFDRMEQTVEEYKYFMRETGLFDMLQNHIISNLYDYVTGVEVGLGSNGRKNRGGDQMEDLVESFIKKTGAEYHKEMYLNDVEQRWNVDLSAVSADGTATKRWDFVVKTPSKIYLVETNFYKSRGSKLNETAKSYELIAEKVKNVDGVEFVWITDGAGWNSARRNLEETFDVMEYMFNIEDMENGQLVELFKE